MTTTTHNPEASPMTTSVDFQCLTIRTGAGVAETDDYGLDRYRYLVTVRSDDTGALIRFTYHASSHDYAHGIRHLDARGLLFAFWAFLSDCTEETFADWCADYGLDADSIGAKRTYDACRSAQTRFGRLYSDDRSPADVLEALAREGIE